MKGPALPALKHATVNAMLKATSHTSLGLVFVDASERETSLPWAQVYRRAKRAAAGLARLGVK
ncbi:AMP-dependent synthetase, partial [Corallococcus sp. CA047B]